MAGSIKVFVSYSWKTEKDTAIVEELEKLCPQRGIQIIRDNKTLKHGDSIKNFMDELSQGDHIITIFSKPYFESPWCMYELLRTFQKGNLGERTHPVIADDCDLQDGDYRLDVVKYWLNKYKNGEVKLKGIDPKLVLNEHQQIKLYRDISQNINELLNFAKDRVTTPLPQLKQKNYAQLLDLIAPIVQHDGKAIQQSDEDFLKEIRQNIEFELNKSEHNSFREHLLQACSYKGKTQEFHNYLIDECTSGRFKEIIQYIESVFVDCYDNIDSANINAVKKLYDIAEGTVSKLVVFNIKNDWMTQFRNHSYLDYSLPEMSSGHIEVVAAREACAIPKFHLHKNSLQANRDVGLESGIKAASALSDIIKHIYARVMKTELPSDLNESKAIANLKLTLQQRKLKPNLKLRESYFLLLPTVGSNSGLADPTVQAKLKELLPDLSLIRIKTGNVEEVFIVEDEELMTAVREFFITLEDYKAK